MFTRVGHCGGFSLVNKSCHIHVSQNTYNMCDHVCFPPPERCVGWAITVINIRHETLNSLTANKWHVFVLYVGAFVQVSQSVYAVHRCVCSVSNVMTSGCRKIDDVIETSHLFFAPSGRGPQVSNSAPLTPPLISRIYLPPFFYPSLLFLPSNHQTPCPLLFSQALRWITGFRNMASVHCSFCLHSGRLWTWQWWRGWCEG